MKKFLSNYYAIIMIVLFVVYNIILNNLKIGGLLYQLFMIILIIVNVFIIIIFRKHIKYKSLTILVYLFIWVFSKNSLQCIFSISSAVTLISVGFLESHFIKVITILTITFCSVYAIPIMMFYLFTFGVGLNEERERNDIYEDMHYFCDNNYEIYSYSAGAMDRYHYSIGKYYEFLDIGGIINISFHERNEVSQKEYEKYLNEHKCILAGDINGSK